MSPRPRGDGEAGREKFPAGNLFVTELPPADTTRFVNFFSVFVFWLV